MVKVFSLFPREKSDSSARNNTHWLAYLVIGEKKNFLGVGWFFSLTSLLILLLCVLSMAGYFKKREKGVASFAKWIRIILL